MPPSSLFDICDTLEVLVLVSTLIWLLIFHNRQYKTKLGTYYIYTGMSYIYKQENL